MEEGRSGLVRALPAARASVGAREQEPAARASGPCGNGRKDQLRPVRSPLMV